YRQIAASASTAEQAPATRAGFSRWHSFCRPPGGSRTEKKTRGTVSKAGRSHPARRSPASVIACLVLLASAPGPAWAIPIAFTDFAAFEAALPGAATVLDFDGLAAGTTIADGETIDGITFHYDFGGVAMLVSDVFDTTSPSNYLSTDDSDVFQDGDDFSLSFDPVNAIGLLFITADELFDGDITLSTGSISATLSAGDAGTPLPDG